MKKFRKAWNGGSKEAAMAEAESRKNAVILANQGFKAHKVMTPEEYAALPLVGWHMVCRDFDGFGGVGIRFLGMPEGDTMSQNPASFDVGKRDTPS